ncbi:MAG: TatD family hydrolase [Patescibacteria group bacterium]
MEVIDVHAHLNFPDFDVDRAVVAERARVAGVGMINVGTDVATSSQAVDLAEKFPDTWATVGQHPNESAPLDLVVLGELARRPGVVAIGECGLDYYRSPTKAQAENFQIQADLARRHNLPLMIHCRPTVGTDDAYLDLLALLEDFPNVIGNVHFFAGSWPTAQKFIDRGFTLSFTGVITFTNDYDEVISRTPVETIMAETDCPFVAPAPFRGRRNEPAHVHLVLERLAQIKGLSKKQMVEITTANARRVFNL